MLVSALKRLSPDGMSGTVTTSRLRLDSRLAMAVVNHLNTLTAQHDVPPTEAGTCTSMRMLVSRLESPSKCNDILSVGLSSNATPHSSFSFDFPFPFPFPFGFVFDFPF